jgi:hypothetical protein
MIILPTRFFPLAISFITATVLFVGAMERLPL